MLKGHRPSGKEKEEKEEKRRQSIREKPGVTGARLMGGRIVAF